MRAEVGVNERSKKKLVSSTWVCHVEKMGDKKLTKRADAQKMEGKRGEEDRKCDEHCLKSDLERVGEERGKR